MSTSGTTIPRKKTKKNVAGARTDPTWKHGIEVAPRKVQCKYCQVVRHGGIYRLKHHLTCTSFNVCPCPQVPDDVRREIVEMLSSNNAGSSKKRTISETGSFSVDGDVEVLTFEIEEPDDAIFLVKESSNHDADRTLAYCFWG
ncbi:hAT transposon superfamily [Striga asiatica]|uniref:HAT transposon superfamily n=1 Tax=Striga asiatica TaxID=4170 RepID=A0A5A7PN33_STRAF|nr:hAT transposon superfamily [Striga asiatica]